MSEHVGIVWVHMLLTMLLLYSGTWWFTLQRCSLLESLLPMPSLMLIRYRGLGGRVERSDRGVWSSRGLCGAAAAARQFCIGWPSLHSHTGERCWREQEQGEEGRKEESYIINSSLKFKDERPLCKSYLVFRQQYSSSSSSTKLYQVLVLACSCQTNLIDTW